MSFYMLLNFSFINLRLFYINLFLFYQFIKLICFFSEFIVFLRSSFQYAYYASLKVIFLLRSETSFCDLLIEITDFWTVLLNQFMKSTHVTCSIRFNTKLTHVWRIFQCRNRKNTEYMNVKVSTKRFHRKISQFKRFEVKKKTILWPRSKIKTINWDNLTLYFQVLVLKQFRSQFEFHSNKTAHLQFN